MLKASYHRHFKRNFKKMSRNVQHAFEERIALFVENPRFPLLFDHPLKGDMKGKRAFSVTGSIRVIYQYIEVDKIMLYKIGPHPHVY